MAKVLATIAGTALIPGVSKNARLYTREAIAKAVHRAQGQLADGKTLSVLTHHEAGDASDRIIGRVTSMDLDENGAARFTADLADTPHARTIASLVDNTTGQPFLSGMSIRGAWVGKVQRVKGPDGSPVETAPDLEFFGIDPTHKPGVEAAGVDAFAWARDGANETTERVLITESVQEARVTAITEETTPAIVVTEAAPSPVLLEAVRALLPGTHVYEDGLCVTCAGVAEAATNPMSKRGAGLSGKSGVAYADPGYQADKRQRYELDTPDHIRGAWSLISKAKNAEAYTAAQLKRIKGRIKAAAKKSGIQIASEGWTAGPGFQVTEALAAVMGDPSCAGSYSLSATNGPTTVTVCSYGLDPADLAVILQRACDAAGAALCALDPDMDGDIDVPGADAEDTDRDMDDDSGQMDNGDGTEDLVRRLMSAVRGESAEDPDALLAEAKGIQPAVTETAPTDDPAPDAAHQEEREVPAVSETTVQEAATAPAASFSQDQVNAAVAAALEAERAARKARKAAKAKPAESAAKAPVTETEDERITRLVEEKLASARAASGPAPVTETEDERIARVVEERMVAERQAITAAGGGPSRKGLVTEHSAARPSADGVPADFPLGTDGAMVPMEKWTPANRAAVSDILQRTYLPYLSRAE